MCLVRTLALLALAVASSSALAQQLPATPAGAQQLPANPAPAHQIGARRIAAGLDRPVLLCAAPGDPTRMFVLEHGTENVRLIKNDALLTTPFLDLSAEISHNWIGLAGLAFHPDYATNGRFYVLFVDTNAHDVLREYHVSANPDIADASSYNVVLDIQGLASATCIRFGPDGMLYVATGGFSWTAGQDGTSYYSKLLRLDVDAPPPHVPADNPYTSPTDGILDLIWAWGLRQPYSFSFDSLTGDLWIGEVGDLMWDEIDMQPASVGLPGTPGYQGGRNYGWACFEGMQCTPRTHCPCPNPSPNFVDPIYQYRLPPGQGTCTIGGYVYRGSAMPWLRGAYVFMEMTSGHLYELRTVNGAPPLVVDHQAELLTAVTGGAPLYNTFGMGEDANGELYVLTTGHVWRLVPAPSPCAMYTSYCYSRPNSASTGARMSCTGTDSIAANDLVLRADLCPPLTTGTFLASQQQHTSTYGNGVLCLGGTIVRLSQANVDALGNASVGVNWNALPGAIAPGQTWYFQLQFRDPAGGGAQLNTTDGVYVTTCP